MEYLRDYVFPDISINMPIEIFQHAIEYGSISRTQTDTTGRVVIDATYCFNVPFGITRKWQIIDNFPMITEISPYVYGKLHGTQKKWRNGKIESIEGFHNGASHGPAISYFDNGVIQQQATYKYGVLQGEKKIYYVNGVVACGIILFKDSYFEKYSNHASGLPKTVTVINGDNCETTVYNEKSNIMKIIRTTNGIMHGVQDSFEYFGDGTKIHTSTTYEMKLKHGPEIVTSIAAKSTEEIPIIICNYKDDELDGYYEKKSRNGHLEQTCYYRNGHLHGPFTQYTSNGHKYLEATYDDGQIHGDRKTYKNNEIATIERYYYGKIDGYYENKNAAGDVISSYTLKKGVYHGEANIIHHGNRIKCVFKNGLIDGPCLTFSHRGVLLKRTYYSDGILDGPDETYENDKVINTIIYKMGVPINKEFEDTSHKIHLLEETSHYQGEHRF